MCRPTVLYYKIQEERKTRSISRRRNIIFIFHARALASLQHVCIHDKITPLVTSRAERTRNLPPFLSSVVTTIVYTRARPVRCFYHASRRFVALSIIRPFITLARPFAPDTWTGGNVCQTSESGRREKKKSKVPTNRN